ncbi:hypothetical protein KFK09_010689 [Dendrobium nobile]|uniref:Uncharacterized protein n=1 Tax=Dendrobium nobile TaxID=94219 RepID=A0A8T3BAP0_DENNO|nr:hypothetical protein KFK09_010689 [Dendrobium nobile]
MFPMCFIYRNASLAVVPEQLGWPVNLWETAASARRCYRAGGWICLRMETRRIWPQLSFSLPSFSETDFPVLCGNT